MNYKFTKPKGAVIQLTSARHVVTLTEYKGHIHVQIAGKTRKSVLTQIAAELVTNPFKAKVVAIYAFRMITANGHNPKALDPLRHTNYAEVFGSAWE